LGEPASKANSRRIVKIGGKIASIKSRKALSYGEAFKLQCPALHPMFTDTDVAVEIDIWYGSRRPDLDDSLILDLLQGKVYANDRCVKRRDIRWGLDKDNPRIEITVRLAEAEDFAGWPRNGH
jgi:Holliday junction resolvase RusA-like endonuclease